MTYNQNVDDKQVLNERRQGCCCSCISWSAIIFGAFVAIGLSFLLNAFGTAIGLTTFNISADNITTVAIGGYVAMLVGGIIAMFFAGWVTGYLNRRHCADNRIGSLAGFIAWCLALIIAAMLAGHIGQLFNLNFTTPANVRMSSVSNSPASVVATTTDNRTVDHNTKAADNRTVVSEEKAIRDIGKALFLTFLLFFAGAVASAIGGYYGMTTCCRDEEPRKI
jgi:hypothetical protein